MRFDEILLEKTEVLSSGERVFINPSHRQMEKIWNELDDSPRALLADDLFVFPGYDTIHRDAMHDLGLHPSDTFGLFLEPKSVTVSSGGSQGEMDEDELEGLEEMLKNDRHLQRIYGPDVFVDAQSGF